MRAPHPPVPRLPVRHWQIWNEPSVPRYFVVKGGFAKPYVRLLAAAYRAVKAADRGATVVTAGLPNFSWRDLQSLYGAGLRGHFDVVAVHPFTGRPASLRDRRSHSQVGSSWPIPAAQSIFSACSPGWRSGSNPTRWPSPMP